MCHALVLHTKAAVQYVMVIIASAAAPPLLYGVWLLARVFLADYFTIPTESMCPTLQPGDKVIANKLTLGGRIYTDFDFDLAGQELKSFRLKGLRRIRHNDIVVFNFPNHDGKLNFIINNVFCKRAIGLPGDSVSAVNGHYRNNNFSGALGIEAEQERLRQMPDTLIWGYWLPPYHDTGWNLKNFGPVYIPRRGDVISISAKEAALYHLLLEWELSQTVTWDWSAGKAYADGKPLRRHCFLHDYYFMAGDNVANSADSRYWGLVPEEYVIGVIGWVIRDKKIHRVAECNQSDSNLHMAKKSIVSSYMP